ncbi:hypothetical protein K469DRAFT_807115, partial [Zopfia rhizophila CBS 207.26]
RLKATEYTVEWVCALPIELAIAQAMLDEDHVELSYNNHDSNFYTLSRIGSYNVVLTCLLAEQMGIGPAAAGTTQMMFKFKFKFICFKLMVRVGSRISVEADIQLGDVVISQPFKQYSRVMQYDFEKTERDGHITRTGFLNAPPKVLLNAVLQLQVNYYQKRSSLVVYLAVFN